MEKEKRKVDRQTAVDRYYLGRYRTLSRPSLQRYIDTGKDSLSVIASTRFSLQVPISTQPPGATCCCLLLPGAHKEGRWLPQGCWCSVIVIPCYKLSHHQHSEKLLPYGFHLLAGVRITWQTWRDLPNYFKYLSNIGQETSPTVSGRRAHASPAVVMTPDTNQGQREE